MDKIRCVNLNINYNHLGMSPSASTLESIAHNMLIIEADVYWKAVS